MALIRTLIFDFWQYFSMALIGLVGAPFAVISRDVTYWIMKFYCRQLFLVMRLVCGIRVEWRGTPPTGACVILSKHQSFLDIMMLFMAVPRGKFIMKKELRWAPILGFYAWRIGATPVDRGKGGAALKAMLDHASREFRAEESQLVIYPQGTRVPPGAVLPYKIGGFRLYEAYQVPAVLAATNCGVFWGKGRYTRRPGTAVVEFFDVIQPGKSVDAFMAEVESKIEARSNALMAEAGFEAAKSA